MGAVGETDRRDGWRLARDGASHPTTMQQNQFAKLRAIAYVAGAESAGDGASGVLAYDRKRAYSAWSYYTSGHAPEAFLIDMEGRVRHRWSRGFREIWPDRKVPEGNPSADLWRRVRLSNNGDLFAIHEGLALLKLDKDSNLIWSKLGGYHHDLDITEDGDIFVLTREARIIPRLHKTSPILEDFITVLAPDGRILKSLSILEAFERSPYAASLLRGPRTGDILHTNTLEILDGSLAYKSPAFAKGNVLISLLCIDTAAIVDMKARKVVWAVSGMWRLQHQPTLLQNGNMLLFDNRGHQGESKVIEFDPFTREIAWMYPPNGPNGFYSKTCGSNQRLANGNTLITETEAGRAFEVAPDHTVVWEFLSPHRAGAEGELIAMLLELVRLDADFPTDWAAQP
jgi:hypothetical protein